VKVITHVYRCELNSDPTVVRQEAHISPEVSSRVYVTWRRYYDTSRMRDVYTNATRSVSKSRCLDDRRTRAEWASDNTRGLASDHATPTETSSTIYYIDTTTRKLGIERVQASTR